MPREASHAPFPKGKGAGGLGLRLFTVVGLVLSIAYALGRCAWPAGGEVGELEYGINFSCKRTEYLGLDCEPTFRRILAELGVRSVRLSAYWSDVEREPGVYDFSALDRLLAIAAEYDARVTVSIGMKAQRYPEFWFPTWLRLAAGLAPDEYPEDNPLVAQALFPYLAVAARHIGSQPVVEAIQVENEPLVHFRGYANGWGIRRSFLAREIEAIRSNDPGGHPIVVSHSSWLRLPLLPDGVLDRQHPKLVSHASWLRRDDNWRWIIDNADVLAQSVYTKRQRGPWRWLYIFPYRIGPWTPDLPKQASIANQSGKQLWIGELQAEPYERRDVDVRQIATAQANSFSARWFRANIRLAQRSGARRVLLWGAEWWAYLRLVRGESELWDLARSLTGGAPRP